MRRFTVWVQTVIERPVEVTAEDPDAAIAVAKDKQLEMESGRDFYVDLPAPWQYAEAPDEYQAWEED